ncbi:hypothetical protein [Vibrio coralliilyticus]|nr:hypothetical protein [Vibrio coralliilyticus]WFB46735.1 hypothetical protein P6988_11400 [Vibrio coralliilyticus]
MAKQSQVKQVLLKTAVVFLQDDRYKIPIDDEMPPPSTIQPTQPRRT